MEVTPSFLIKEVPCEEDKMGDAIALLPTDKIPSTATEKEAIILLYGEEDVACSKEENLNINNLVHASSSSVPVKTSTVKPSSSSSSSFKSEMTSLLLIIVMFGIWTCPPFSEYMKTLLPFFGKFWVAFWIFQILFFSAYAFFVLNIETVRVKS
jgi:hypothetical protein